MFKADEARLLAKENRQRLEEKRIIKEKQLKKRFLEIHQKTIENSLLYIEQKIKEACQNGEQKVIFPKISYFFQYASYKPSDAKTYFKEPWLDIGFNKEEAQEIFNIITKKLEKYGYSYEKSTENEIFSWY